MIMFGTMAFTPENAMEVAQCYESIAPIPDFITLTGPFIRSNIESGIHTTSIFNIDDALVEEGIAYLHARYAVFSSIANVTATVEEWLGVGTALQVLHETNSVTQALENISFRI